MLLLAVVIHQMKVRAIWQDVCATKGQTRESVTGRMLHWLSCQAGGCDGVHVFISPSTGGTPSSYE